MCNGLKFCCTWLERELFHMYSVFSNVFPILCASSKKNHVKKDTFIACTQNDFYLKKKKIKQKQNKLKHKKKNNSRYCEIAETCLRHKSNYVI